MIRDIERKIEGDATLAARFRPLLMLAHWVLTQNQRQRGRKVYALHAPEMECILGSSPTAFTHFEVGMSCISICGVSSLGR